MIPIECIIFLPKANIEETFTAEQIDNSQLQNEVQISGNWSNFLIENVFENSCYGETML